ncbi:MAG: hypothetical protein CL946_10220 [Ectothiorhodospiraceae bacterium]|nr:hypothetical protein [Ectothiorhodospiraceae bacterium]
MRHTLLILFIVLISTSLYAQQTVQRDNGNVGGAYLNLNPDAEESCILEPDGPCDIVSIQAYISGGPGQMQIVICGDPSEGLLPPTGWVWSYNAYGVVNYTHSGTAGWVNIDISSLALKSDGYDRFVVMHRSYPGGPRFTIDNQGQTQPPNSFIMDPNFNNSLGFPGLYNTAGGHYMVRLQVKYLYPLGPGSQPPPNPTFDDFTVLAGLTDGGGNPIPSARCSVADWNNDGWDDIVIGSNWFQNNGNGTFMNVSGQIGITANGCTFGDIDNDGDLDVYAVNGGTNDKIWRNDGNGSFTDITAATQIINDAPTVTPIWFDYNRDGYLDLYISNGRRTVNNQEVYFQDALWENNHNGTFTDVTIPSGIAAMEPAPFQDCWGAAPCDYNHDGWVDIFVATYRLAPDRLYKNEGNGTFTDVGPLTGAQGIPTASPDYFGHGIGCDFTDMNADGLIDLIVGNLGHPDYRGQFSNPSLLFLNDGPTNFLMRDKHMDMGLKFKELNAGVVSLDFDLDGHNDLFHCQYSYNPFGGSEPYRYSRLYRNTGPPDFKLKDETWELGALVHGAWTAVRGDFDRDGDVDLVVASPREYVKLFRNLVSPQGDYVAIRLKGSPVNNVVADGYGAKVNLYFTGGGKRIQHLMGGGSGTTASQNSNELIFGLGQNTIDRIEILWPNGGRVTYTGLQNNMNYTLHYNGTVTPIELAAFTARVDGNNNVMLTWKTVSETSNAGFEVQRSADGEQFEKIGFVQGNGTTTLPQLYTFTDKIDEVTYYRLKQIDYDGTYEYSNIIQAQPAVPVRLDLAQNYPNPFSESTSIAFTLPSAGDVELAIHDPLGRLVKTVVAGTLESGNHTYTWNGTDAAGERVAAGAYFYTLKANGITSSKRLNVR